MLTRRFPFFSNRTNSVLAAHRSLLRCSRSLVAIVFLGIVVHPTPDNDLGNQQKPTVVNDRQLDVLVLPVLLGWIPKRPGIHVAPQRDGVGCTGLMGVSDQGTADNVRGNIRHDVSGNTFDHENRVFQIFQKAGPRCLALAEGVPDIVGRFWSKSPTPSLRSG